MKEEGSEDRYKRELNYQRLMNDVVFCCCLRADKNQKQSLVRRNQREMQTVANVTVSSKDK